MIVWFLRLIDHPLLRQVSQLETDKAVLQDRLERGDQERARLWEQNKELIHWLNTYHQMDKNLEWQGRGWPAPHPDAPHLPPNLVNVPDNSPAPVHRSQGSQMVVKAYRDFKDLAAKKFGIEKPVDAN